MVKEVSYETYLLWYWDFLVCTYLAVSVYCLKSIEDLRTQIFNEGSIKTRESNGMNVEDSQEIQEGYYLLLEENMLNVYYPNRETLYEQVLINPNLLDEEAKNLLKNGYTLYSKRTFFIIWKIIPVK